MTSISSHLFVTTMDTDWSVMDLDATVSQWLPNGIPNGISVGPIVTHQWTIDGQGDDWVFRDLVNQTTDLFDRVGFHHDSTRGIIEYWRYTDLISAGDHVHLDVHMDDYAVTTFPVYTAIYYLTKTVTGGDLQIHDHLLDVVHTIDVTPPPHRVRVVLLHGSVPHSVSNIESDGVRECVVVQLRRH